MSAETLQPWLSGKSLSKWQVATNGVWEEALAVSPAPQEDDLRAVSTWLQQASDDVAVEAFFADEQDDFFFFGIRIQSMLPEEKQAFLKAIFEGASAAADFNQICKTIQDQLSGQTLLTGKPDLLELGAEGFWASYGSYVVWDGGEQKPSSMGTIAENAAHLLAPFKRSIMLEFAWKTPVPMWIGIPVSEKNQDGEYQFSAE